MIGNPSFFTRRSFLSSLTSAALVSNNSLGQIARLKLFDALPETQPGEGSVEFASSDRKLVDGFHWAKTQALDYVRESPVIGPWYEAALPGRNAFCMRDVSHMSTGAQFLGLGPRTRNMLRQFAEHISASKKWCTWWEITGEGKPAPVDYKSDQSFWYCLPANFDVMDACYRQWLWSRDNAYLDDVFLNYLPPYGHGLCERVGSQPRWSAGASAGRRPHGHWHLRRRPDRRRAGRSRPDRGSVCGLRMLCRLRTRQERTDGGQ